MRTVSSIGIVGAALAAAFGVVDFACTSTTATDAAPGAADSGPHEGEIGVPSSDGGQIADAGTTGDAAAAAVIECDGGSPVVVGGQDTGFVQCGDGVRHRVKATACPNLLPRASGGACTSVFAIDAGLGGCAHDSDCTAKPLGTCALGDGHFASCGCSYGCVSDADCSTGEICECGDPVGRCVASNCSDDGTCAAGRMCASIATSWGGCSWDELVPSYICQTAQDTCLSDTDCAVPVPACAYDADAGARSCHAGQLACPGRPFLVDGAARVASTVARGDWSAAGAKPAVADLDATATAKLADRWKRVAQMEHASVAAFARFALELLALGAPADLVIGAQRAMADETEHARLSFALAGAYAAEETGPGPLAMEGSFASVTAQSTFATLVREGCIGETLAAVEATEALARARDLRVREVLGRIARDETQHAELSWRAARWILDSADDSFRAWAKGELDRAVAECGRALLARAEPESAVLEAHGVLDDVTRSALAREALRDLVAPCARTLFARVRPMHAVALAETS